MLKTGEKILAGSDSSGKYFIELTSGKSEIMQAWQIKITLEGPKKSDSVTVPVKVLEEIYEMLHQKEVRRPVEEE